MYLCDLVCQLLLNTGCVARWRDNHDPAILRFTVGARAKFFLEPSHKRRRLIAMQYPSVADDLRLLTQILDRIDQLRPWAIQGARIDRDVDGIPVLLVNATYGTRIRLSVEEAWRYMIALHSTDLRLQCDEALLRPY